MPHQCRRREENKASFSFARQKRGRVISFVALKMISLLETGRSSNGICGNADLQPSIDLDSIAYASEHCIVLLSPLRRKHEYHFGLAVISFLHEQRKRRGPSKLPSASHLCRVATAANPTPSLSLLLPLEGGNRSEAETGGSPSRSLALSLPLSLLVFPVALVCEIMPHFIPPLPNGRDGTERGEAGRGGREA